MAEITHAEGSGKKEQSTPVASGATKEFRRNVFFNQETTGTTFTERGRKKNGIESQWVSIDGELTEKYSNYLRDYVTNLKRAADNDPSLLRSPNHTQDKMLLEYFQDEGGKLDSGTERDSAFQKKIDNFFGDKRGWEITTLLMEQSSAMKLYALGLYQTTSQDTERGGMPSTDRQYTGEGQGLGNKLNEKVRPHLGSIGKGTALLTAAAVVGSIGGSREGISGAAVAAGAVLLTPLLRKTYSPGVTFDTESSVQALQMMKSNPSEAAFAKQMWGVDVNDFNIVGSSIQRGPGMAMSNKKPELLLNEVRAALSDRHNFYRSLGIPASQIDRLPEQFVFDSLSGVKTEAEDLGVEFQKRFLEVLDPNNNIKDTFGNTRGQLAFVPQNIDVQDALEKVTKARSQVMTETVRNFLNDQEAKPPTARPRQEIVDKINDRKNDEGKVRQERLKTHKERLQATSEDVESLTGEKGKFESYEEARKELGKAGDDFRKEFPLYADLLTAVAEKRKYLTDNTDPTAYPMKKSDIVARQQAQIDHLWLVKYPGGPPAALKANEAVKQYQSIIDQVKPLFDAEKELLDGEMATTRSELARLLEIQQSERQKTESLSDSQETTKSVNDTLKLMENNRALLTTTFGIPSGDLSTKSVHELLEAINASGAAGAWPASENGKQENRRKVLLAVTEQLAVDAEAADTTRAARLPVYTSITDPATLNYPENQLRTFSAARIESELAVKATALGITPPTSAEVQQAIAEANNRLQVRQGAIEQVLKNLEVQSVRDQEAVNGVSLDDEIGQLQAAVDLFDRQDKILGSASAVVSDSGIVKFVDISKFGVAAVGKEVTQEEKDLKAEKGYYEFMNILFGYQEKADRGEYFKKISTALPPKELASLLDAALDLGHSGGNLSRVLPELANRVLISGDVSPADMRQAFIKIIDRLQSKAITMP